MVLTTSAVGPTGIIKATTAGVTFAVLSMIFCNTTATAQTISVYVYPTGGSAVDGTCIIKTMTIPAYDSYIWSANEKFILAPLDGIYGLASAASSITVTVNGMEI